MNAVWAARWNQRVTRIPGGEHEQRDESEPPVEQEEPADRRDECERVHDERRESLVEDIGESIDIAGQPRDDPASLLLREIPERE